MIRTKTALYVAVLQSGISKSELARRLGIPKTNPDRLFVLKHGRRLGQIEAALKVFGKRLQTEALDAA